MKTSRQNQGFTLIELLTVIAIVATLAAILLPVFARAREKSWQTVCLSNERQLGLGFLQYVQDNDGVFPNGIRVNGRKLYWPGEGWAGQCLPYLGDAALLHCPSDTTSATGRADEVVSYGYNINLAGTFTVPPSAGLPLTSLTAPPRSVLLFEVSGVTVNLNAAREGAAPGETLGRDLSSSSNGLDHRLYARSDDVTTTENRYATGDLGGRHLLSPAQTQFSPALGRHDDGSNFLLADGHSLWLRGSAVSSGVSAPAPDCDQDDAPVRPRCALPAATLSAAGAQSAAPFRVTFSTN